MSEKSLSISFLAISDRYATFFLKFLTKWLTSAILDVRNSLSIAFLAISDRYASLFYFFEMFDKMAAVGHFGCPKFTFDRNSGHFRSIQNFFSGGHFGCPKITLDRISGHFRLIGHFGCPKFTFDGISGHFRSIRNFIYFVIFLTKWPPAAILDVRNNFRSNFWPFQIDTQLFCLFDFF